MLFHHLAHCVNFVFLKQLVHINMQFHSSTALMAGGVCFPWFEASLPKQSLFEESIVGFEVNDVILYRYIFSIPLFHWAE